MSRSKPKTEKVNRTFKKVQKILKNLEKMIEKGTSEKHGVYAFQKRTIIILGEEIRKLQKQINKLNK